MTPMRAPAADLPIMLEDASFIVREAVILDRVSLSLSPGAPTVLIGPNGGGKTTLMRLAMGLVEPTRGKVSYGGRTGVPPTRRAIVFQRPVMLRRSVAGNLNYALASAKVARADRAARASELLNTVGLSGFGERPARRLSGGEQQRLALARAWALHPEVLFLDEPTASLDPSATREIESIIRAFDAAGTKIVMATHNFAQARRLADEVIYLHQGRVLERAAVERFFSQPATAEAAAFIRGELPWT